MPTGASTRKAVWFYNLELALLTDGGYQLSVSATSVDENEPQLLHQDMLDERVSTIDDALARLRDVLVAST